MTAYADREAAGRWGYADMPVGVVASREVVPAGGFVLSGHLAAREFLTDHVDVGGEPDVGDGPIGEVIRLARHDAQWVPGTVQPGGIPQGRGGDGEGRRRQARRIVDEVEAAEHGEREPELGRADAFVCVTALFDAGSLQDPLVRRVDAVLRAKIVVLHDSRRDVEAGSRDVRVRHELGPVGTRRTHRGNT